MALEAATLRPVVVPIPRRAWLVLLVAVALLWLVAFEGGVVSQLVGRSSLFLHELFHDGRHLFGVPCH